MIMLGIAGLIASLGMFGPLDRAISHPLGPGSGILLLSVASLLLALAGILTLRAGRDRLVFDRQLGMYWKGFGEPDPSRDAPKHAVSGRLYNIHALQILSEWVTPAHEWGSPYRRFELNLVLQDGARIFLMDHLDPSIIKLRANQLATFLRVPVWDWSYRNPYPGKFPRRERIVPLGIFFR
jgi:hypothetical protein